MDIVPMPTFRQYSCNRSYAIVFNMNGKASYYEKINDNDYDANNIEPSATSSFSSSYSDNNSNLWTINQKCNALL